MCVKLWVQNLAGAYSRGEKRKENKAETTLVKKFNNHGKRSIEVLT